MNNIVALLLFLVKFAKSAIEPFIVGGNFTSIESYPHSAFLTVNCVLNDGNRIVWICGASILNQRLLLTAGHCLYSCTKSSDITINVGSTNRVKGFATFAHSFIIHENYNNEATAADIGMIKSRVTLKLSSKISRVILTMNPPPYIIGQLAGWGLVNDIDSKYSPMLKSLNQRIWSNKECVKLLGHLPQGTLCAGNRSSKDYAAPGDSGSALLIRGYIQIGLVSYKVPSISRSLIVYTDVAYYYNWIEKNAKTLYCV